MLEEDKFRELETDRLFLKKINDEDAEMLYNNIFNNFDWYKLYYQLPFDNLEEYQKLVSKYKEWYSNGNHFRWGIVEKNNNQMIGLIQLHTKNNLNNYCKLGYIIGYNYEKNGYMKEALTKIIDFSFNVLNYHRLEAEIVVDNINSIKLAESVGMKFESIKKESYKLNNKYYDQNVYVIINIK